MAFQAAAFGGQQGSISERRSRPATTEEMVTYSFMGAVIACDLTINRKIGLEAALGSAAMMVSEALLFRHGGLVADSQGKKLSREQLLNGSVATIVMTMKELCYEDMNPAERKEVADYLQELCQATEQPGGPPDPQRPPFCAP